MFSNFVSVDNMEKREIQFFSKFWHGQFRNTLLVDNCIVLFLHVLIRVVHVSGVCINAIHVSAKRYCLKYKYFDCSIPHEYLVQKSGTSEVGCRQTWVS